MRVILDKQDTKRKSIPINKSPHPQAKLNSKSEKWELEVNSLDEIRSVLEAKNVLIGYTPITDTMTLTIIEKGEEPK